jgi:hypothetical protein
MQSDVKVFTIMDGFSHYSVTRGPNEDFEVSTSKNAASNQLLSRVGKMLGLKCPLLIFEAETVFASLFALSSNPHIESRANCTLIVFDFNMDLKEGTPNLKREDILRDFSSSNRKLLGTVFLSRDKLRHQQASEGGCQSNQ